MGVGVGVEIVKMGCWVFFWQKRCLVLVMNWVEE